MRSKYILHVYKTTRGVSPLQEALKCNHVNIAQFLRFQGAKEPPSTKELGEKFLQACREGALEEGSRFQENG